MEKVGVRCSDMRSAPRTNQTTKGTSMKAAKAIPTLTAKDKARFWSKVERSGSCWLWTAGKDKGGYGTFDLNGMSVKAHRVSYTLANGEIPTGMCVLHKCDTPACVSPDCLFLGTHQDNMDDMMAKGRNNQPRGNENGSRIHPERMARGEAHYSITDPEKLARGEANGSAKLTAEKVSEIRSRYSNGGVSQRRLSREYEVDQKGIWAIIHRKIWQHVA